MRLLLWLLREIQNESDSTTEALQDHFPTGRSWGVKSHHFSPETVTHGEETNTGNMCVSDTGHVDGIVLSVLASKCYQGTT